MTAIDDKVFASARLDAVRRTKLLDTGPEEPFDRLTRLACRLLDVPFAFVTVVDERRSFWKSCIGVDATELADRQNPVEESFCQYVIATDDAVIIEDARLNPMTSRNPSIVSMGVVAWAGFPVRSPDGEVLGTFCVVDNKTRHWSARDLEVLDVAAHAASGEVALRISLDDAVTAVQEAKSSLALAATLATTLQDSLRRADGTLTTLGRTGTLLGATTHIALGVDEEVLRPGDLLLLYTDGVTEARDGAAGGLLGQAGLERILGEIDADSASLFVKELQRRVMDFGTGTLRDDIAIVGIHVPGP